MTNLIKVCKCLRHLSRVATMSVRLTQFPRSHGTTWAQQTLNYCHSVTALCLSHIRHTDLYIE